MGMADAYGRNLAEPQRHHKSDGRGLDGNVVRGRLIGAEAARTYGITDEEERAMREGRELPRTQAPGPLDAQIGVGVVPLWLGLEGGHHLALLLEP